MKRLAYLLIVLSLNAIPIAAQSKAKIKPAVDGRPFYRIDQSSQRKPSYRTIPPPANAAQLNAALMKAVGVDRAELLVRLAKYYLAAGLDDSARREFNRALDIDSGNEILVTDVVRLINNTGIIEQCENAAKLASDFLNNHGKNEGLLIERAKARACARRFEDAFDDISTVIETNNRNRNYRSMRESYLLRFANQDYALATRQRIIDDLEKLTSTTPSSAGEKFPIDILLNEYLSRARYYDYHQKFDLELADLNRAVEIFPDFALMPRATLYRKMNRYAEALADLNRGIDLLTKRNGDLFTYGLFYERAEIFVILGRYDEAIADYQKCMSIYPRTAAYYEAKISRAKQMINK